MPRPTQAPTETPTVAFGEPATTLSHPAFGQVRVHRVQGSTVCYGSPFEHHHYVVLTLSASEMQRSLSSDRYYTRDKLVEIAMTEHQFARMVAGANSGSGVPVTIKYLNGQVIPGLPLREEFTEFKSELAEKARLAVEGIERAKAMVETVLGSGVSKVKKDAILAELTRAHQEVAANLPFVLEQFAGVMEDTAQSARMDIESAVAEAARATGLRALTASPVPPLRSAQAVSQTEVVQAEVVQLASPTDTPTDTPTDVPDDASPRMAPIT